MRSVVAIFSTIFFIQGACAQVASAPKKEIVGIKYYNQMMGNVHQNSSRYSQVLTTISCNYPVKITRVVGQRPDDLMWSYVTVGPYEGFIMNEYLSDRKADCFEENYSKFFDGLELDINDLYYWARLYDQYVHGKSKVKQ